jgi:hypothetical protein
LYILVRLSTYDVQLLSSVNLSDTIRSNEKSGGQCVGISKNTYNILTVSMSHYMQVCHYVQVCAGMYENVLQVCAYICMYMPVCVFERIFSQVWQPK